MTLLFTHPAAAQHLTPPGHGEQQARYAAVMDALADLTLDRREAPLARDADLLRCHPQSYLDFLRDAAPTEGLHQLDEDTFLSPGTLEAAYRSAGGAVAAVDAVLDGAGANAFVAMRPPGHHALADQPMGFCLFGNAAIAAKYALDVRGLDRVAVLDFDVHHGNGTQDVLWDDKRAMFASSHQFPLYPGTGAASERGAHGQIVNVPLASGSDGARAREVWRKKFGQPPADAAERARQLRFLAARGFSGEVARRALDAADDTGADA